jgi:hypothetical protein
LLSIIERSVKKSVAKLVLIHAREVTVPYVSVIHVEASSMALHSFTTEGMEMRYIYPVPIEWQITNMKNIAFNV